MARRSSNIPKYRRARAKRSLVGRLIRFVIKLVIAFLILSLLWVFAYRFINPPTTATMVGDQIAGRGAVRDWMAIGEIDRDMVRAAIAAEDGKFCQHNGFDFEAIEDAMKRNASGGRIRGGSTISQQTAKTTFLWNGGGYVRKGAEAWFTFLIENLWGKQRIMEVYLNSAETGLGTYGVNAGSLRYFGHDASAMSASEAARIAAVLPLPKKRGAIAPKGFTRRYGNTITARIATVGRDGLDACIYKGLAAPVNKAPPPTARKARPLPGEEYETATPPPPAETVDAPAINPDALADPPLVDMPVVESMDEPVAEPPPPSPQNEF